MATTLHRLPAHKYNRGSVERGLTHHFGEGHFGWMRDGKGYSVHTGIGILRLATLREAALVVIACAEKERRMERAAREAAREKESET